MIVRRNIISIVLSLILLVVAAAASTTTTTTTTTTIRRSLEDDLPWPNDTPVYWNFPNDGGWWKGTIESYDTDKQIYTIRWEDDSIEYYDNNDMIDQMVANAQNDPTVNGASDAAQDTAPDVRQYSDGTPVSYKEKGIWYDGSITSYDDTTKIYTITWTDRETQQIHPGDVLDQMVSDAQLDDDQTTDDALVDGSAHTVPDHSSCLWEDGTSVAYFDTDDQQWYVGTILECVGTDGFHPTSYTVEWPVEASDDGVTKEQEQIRDDDTINQMVANAETINNGDDPSSVDNSPDREVPIYPKGTTVYHEFDGEGWWIGEIESYSNGVYGIRWSDNSVDMFDATDPAMEGMVEAANFIPDSDDDAVLSAGPYGGGPAPFEQEQSSTTKNGMKPAGAIFLTLVVLGALAVSVFGVMKYRARKTSDSQTDVNASNGADNTASTAAEEPYEDNVNYRDDPNDKFPKII